MVIAATTVFDTIKLVLEDMGIETIQVTGSTHLKANLDMDSQEVVELQVALEKCYSIHFPAGFLNRDLSIQELMQKLQKLIA